MRRRSRVVSGLTVASALFAAAGCGQHSGVYTDGSLTDAAGASLGSGTMVVVDPETGRTVTVAVGEGAPEASLSSLPVDGGQPGIADAPESVPASRRAALTIARERPPIGGNSTGVTDSTIKIGVHVPITGTAPVPATATESLKHYWNYLCNNERFIGERCIEIVWMDDESTASKATSVCKEMVQEDRVFMLMGVAGSNMINACARYAATVGVPYFAGGSVEAALADLYTHFSMSMPHTRQAPLVADVLVDRMGAKTVRNGMVRTDTALTVEVQEVIDSEMARRGARIDVHQVVDALYGDAATDIASVVHTFKVNDVRNVYFYAGPMHFVHFVREAAKQDYHPRLVGSGPAWALEMFLGPACGTDGAAHGALTFSPWPALRDHARFDPEFAKANGSGDFDWWMWGLMKTVGKLLALPGRDLSRERLLWYTARANVASGVFPPVSFTPTDHFGGESMHLLRADCKRENPAWITDKEFVRPVHRER